MSEAPARYAVGDLTLDVLVPAGWRASYSLTGSLLVDHPEHGDFELSVLTIAPPEGALRHARQAAERPGARVLVSSRSQVVVATENDRVLEWLGGMPGQLAIATAARDASAALIAAVDACLLSAGPAIDPLDWRPGEVAIADLRPSHAPWLDQRRASLAAATGWDGELPVGAAAVEVVWRRLLAGEESDEVVPAILEAVSVALGDHLCRCGFAWCFSRDDWGTALSVVADRGRSNVVVVPSSFVGKRYERREDGWFSAAVSQIAAQVAKVRHASGPARPG